ncbi:MAG: DUF1453 family protein [Chloroflexi bacterium]|nr:DUF1453 family protein [Chloroflexota bacterium]
MRIADLSNPLIDAAGLLLVGVLLLMQMRQRRVSVRRLWLVPLVLVLLTAVTLVRSTPGDLGAWGWIGVGLLLGLLVGFVRGTQFDVHRVDTDAAKLLVQNTQLGVMLWLVVFAGRVVVRQVVGRSNPDPSIAGLATSALLAFGVGMVVANALATYRAYQSRKRSLAW